MALIKKPAGATKQKKRVGRGQASGWGCTAGKGNNGQNARSGGGVRPGFEGGQMPLYRRVARRGFSNYPFKQKIATINLSDLDRVFNDGDEVGIEALLASKLVKNQFDGVKLLSTGEISKKLTLKYIPCSKAAAEKIVAAGGKVEGLEPQETEAKA